MLMSRKHFIAIAEKLEWITPCKVAQPTGYKHRMIMWRTSVEAMAEVCQEFNGSFDRDRFYDACGYPEGRTKP